MNPPKQKPLGLMTDSSSYRCCYGQCIQFVLAAAVLVSLSGCLSPLHDATPVFTPNPSASTNPISIGKQAQQDAAKRLEIGRLAQQQLVANHDASPASALPTTPTVPTATNPALASNQQFQQHSQPIIRGQAPGEYFGARRSSPLPYPSSYPSTNPVQAAVYQGGPTATQVQPVQYGAPAPGVSPNDLWGGSNYGVPSGPPANIAAPGTVPPAGFPGQADPLWGSPNISTTGTFGQPIGPPTNNLGIPNNLADIIVNVQETQTGRFMIGAAVNSDAGVTGQITIDERNFDIRNPPTFRGGGQGLRIEALPGSQVQRYMVQFTDPYFLNTRIPLNVSGFLFDRQFFDWNEQRLGGRFGLGYRVSPDLSLSGSIRAERIRITDPRVPGVAALDEVIGRNELFSGKLSLIQDTRDIPFQPTQGYYFEVGYEQVFGTFDYGRFDADFRRYFLLAERPDGSGRHVLGFSNRVGISGEDTPIYENYFAGGYSTLRGFDFRRASPQDSTVTIGGRFQFLGSAEYLFPITADDMVKGVAFVDYGTIEEDIEINEEDFRVALGFGLRINIPAMGPAPIALDFAVPIAREETDEIRNFSFYMGVSR